MTVLEDFQNMINVRSTVAYDEVIASNDMNYDGQLLSKAKDVLVDFGYSELDLMSIMLGIQMRRHVSSNDIIQPYDHNDDKNIHKSFYDFMVAHPFAASAVGAYTNLVNLRKTVASQQIIQPSDHNYDTKVFQGLHDALETFSGNITPHLDLNWFHPDEVDLTNGPLLLEIVYKKWLGHVKNFGNPYGPEIVDTDYTLSAEGRIDPFSDPSSALALEFALSNRDLTLNHTYSDDLGLYDVGDLAWGYPCDDWLAQSHHFHQHFEFDVFPTGSDLYLYAFIIVTCGAGWVTGSLRNISAVGTMDFTVE